MSSSGFVPMPFSKRVLKEYGVSLSTPLSLEMVPLPSFKPPRQTADALRFMFALCVGPSVNSLRLVKGYQRFPPTSSGTWRSGTERDSESRSSPAGAEALNLKGAVQPQRTQRTQRESGVSETEPAHLTMTIFSPLAF